MVPFVSFDLLHNTYIRMKDRKGFYTFSLHETCCGETVTEITDDDNNNNDTLTSMRISA